MKQTNALRQKHYRQRLALAKVRNEYTVTLLLKQCELAGIDVWPLLTETAITIFEHNGDGVEFIRRMVPLIYSVVTTKVIMDKISTQADTDRRHNDLH